MSTTKKSDLEQYASVLRDERARVMDNIKSFERELELSISEESEEHGLESHQADLGSVTFVRTQSASLKQREEDLLSEINSALERINRGEYGTCQVGSNHPIEEDRLKALPWATTCKEHADTT